MPIGENELTSDFHPVIFFMRNTIPPTTFGLSMYFPSSEVCTYTLKTVDIPSLKHTFAATIRDVEEFLTSSLNTTLLMLCLGYSVPLTDVLDTICTRYGDAHIR